MTGDAPQPGQTPRSEGNTWTWSDPGTGAWWRGDLGPQEPPPATRAKPSGGEAATLEPPKQAQHTGQAAAAHEAGMQDVTAALLKTPPETKGAESPHDKVDDERFNSEGTTSSYAARTVAEPQPVDPEHEPTIVDLLAALPAEDTRPAPAQTAHIEGQTVENRPTVVLPRFRRAKDDQARADRKLQDAVRAERTAALLETSPFWRTEEERAADAAWPPQATREKLAHPPRRKPRDPRRPLGGLIALLALGLVAAFFSWVSAEPFWLAVGHGQEGTAVVSRCSGSGVTQRCMGTFTADSGAYAVQDLALLGVQPGQKAGGSVMPARMVSMTSRQAFTGETGLLVHLRWTLGFLLVIICGLGIAGLTGARRLENARARRGAVLLSLAGPLVLLAGFLVATY
ncbi:hypothetical protein [Actinoplanes sp. TFC3]|uniref:hypothetical protein n=1 Tax=Actinoplanes sp. TFC3 TaxID=1710355 RepID=UPI00082E9EC8|nr:hypothetical protein [Actinoplanes sp. TFC3]